MDANEKSMLMRTQKDVLESFILTYRNEHCLWNTKSKEYRDRQRKERGYTKLIQILKGIDPTANRDHVVKKINNIRSSYRKEKKKVEQSIRNGAEGDGIYQPKLWYYHLLRFLDDLEGDINDEYQEIYEEHFVDTVLEDDDETSEMKPDVLAVSSFQSPTSGLEISNRATSSLKRKSQYEVEHLTSDVLLSVEDHTKHLPILGDEDHDTFDIFGKLVACKLRNLPRQQHLLAEKIINDTLFEAEMGFLTLSHRLVSSNQTQYQPQPHYRNTPSDQHGGKSSSPPLDAEHRPQHPYYYPSGTSIPNAVQKIRPEEYPHKSC